MSAVPAGAALRVAQVTVRYPPAVGGVETYVCRLSGALARRGVLVRIHTTRTGWPPGAEALPPPGAELRVYSTYPLPGAAGYPLVPGWLGAWPDADVLHGHGHHLPSADLPWLARRLRRVPFVLSPYFHPATTWRWRLYERTLGALTIRADVTVLVSRHEERLLRRAGLRPRRLALVPPAVELPAQVEPAARREPVVLFVGRLRRGKGVDVLAAALPEVLRRVPEARALVVGPDEGGADGLRALAGTHGRVRLLGRVDSETLADLYRRSAVLAFPSTDETFGIVLLEAMAAGVPVVAARAAATPEVVTDGESGLLHVPGDHAGLAAALTALLLDGAQRDALAAAARERVARHYLPEVQAAAMEELYRSVVR